jgi:hypothetical protein
MLLAAFITKAYFRANDVSEKDSLAKVRQWPQGSDARRTAMRQTYMGIVAKNNSAWQGNFLRDAQRALQNSGVLAAEASGAAEDAIVNSDRNFEYYFTSTLTLRYDANAPTPFTAAESTGTNPGRLPAPITMPMLQHCKGSMAQFVESGKTLSDTGVREELANLPAYAAVKKTKVYAEQADRAFWVAVGL